MYSFFFWQNILSPHQMPFIRELAELGHDVTVISERDMTADRAKMGWSAPDAGRCKIILYPELDQIEKLILNSPADSIHVLAGARLLPLGKQATSLLIRHKRRMGIISEAPDQRGSGIILRWLKYTLERCGPGRHYDFILAMGEIGTRWFRACGYPAAKVFMFGYVVESAPESTPISREKDAPTRILYGGQLIQRKGLDVLLNALAQVEVPYTCDIIGSGPMEAEWKELADRLNLSSKIRWLGQLPAGEVRQHMQQADLFVLPTLQTSQDPAFGYSLY